VIHVALWLPIFLKPAILFEISPSLIALFEAFLRPPFRLNPMIYWIDLDIDDTVSR
jgi:hypothetical protein